MTTIAPAVEEVEIFLTDLHGAPVTDIEPLPGGYWSAAFAYRAGDRELVLRVGSVPEGFEMDRAAMAFGRPDLPVPEVLAIGEGLGAGCAISVRHHGRFLESIAAAEVAAAGPGVERMLAALRAVPAAPDAPAEWHGEQPQSTWRAWLRRGLMDVTHQRVSGWRATLAADPDLDRLFRACETRVGELVDACPERRDLVHGDLLNRNVLIAEDLSRITAVYSWKCSVRGDFLFDVAWCTLWGPWHPGIAALDLFHSTLRSPTLSRADLVDAAERHHCYELQIGASHLGWNAFTGDQESLRAVAERTAQLLERGPVEAAP